MPELPEVENVRRSLAHRILGRRVVAVTLHRGDIVEGNRSPTALLEGSVISEILRHGKQLAIVAHLPTKPRMDMRGSDTAVPLANPCLCVHLGMTGSLCCGLADAARTKRDHVHLSWELDDGRRVEFRDPRRFGGVWTFPSLNDLWETRWKLLGPDALHITPAALAAALGTTRRPIKAALLDQNLLAGLGNIYVDELLFAAGVHPLTPGCAVPAQLVRRIVLQMRLLLARAIAAGGSTLRDYVNAEGEAGGFQKRHKVYGRSGMKCHRCRNGLKDLRLAGRMTVYCPICQPHRVIAALRGTATVKMTTDEIMALTRGAKGTSRRGKIYVGKV